MPKSSEALRKSRIVIPVTEEEFAFAREQAGEQNYAPLARRALRDAGLLPPLDGFTVAAKAKKGAR